MILIIPLSDFHIFAKLFRASKNRKFDMPNLTTNLKQVEWTTISGLVMGHGTKG